MFTDDISALASWWVSVLQFVYKSVQYTRQVSLLFLRLLTEGIYYFDSPEEIKVLHNGQLPEDHEDNRPKDISHQVMSWFLH